MTSFQMIMLTICISSIFVTLFTLHKANVQLQKRISKLHEILSENMDSTIESNEIVLEIAKTLNKRMSHIENRDKRKRRGRRGK